MLKNIITDHIKEILHQDISDEDLLAEKIEEKVLDITFGYTKYIYDHFKKYKGVYRHIGDKLKDSRLLPSDEDIYEFYVEKIYKQ